jgi:hypothetical protein
MNDFRSSMTSFVDTSVGTRDVSHKASIKPQRSTAHTQNRDVGSGDAPKWLRIVESDASVFPGQVATDTVLHRHMEESSNAKIASQWKQHLFSVHGATDVDSISETIEYVFEAFAQLGPSSLDLRGIASNNVNAEHLVAVLRATNANKHAIPGWEHALGEAPEALRRAGLNPAEVLVGLL